MISASAQLPYKKGIALSAMLHAVVFAVVLVKMPNILPQPKAQVMQVKLVTAKDTKKVVEKPRPVRSQQSDAPPAPPKEKPKPKPKPKEAPPTGTRMVNESSAKSVKVPEPKPAPVPEPEPEKLDEPVSRPDKLDKTPDKEHVMKAKEAAPVPQEDAFLAALSFVEDLEDKQSALSVGEDIPSSSIERPNQHEIAMITRHVKQNWYWPSGLASGKLNAMVEVHVKRDGSVISARVSRSSGDASFDSSLLRAVRKSVPLPIPVEKYNTYKILDLNFSN